MRPGPAVTQSARCDRLICSRSSLVPVLPPLSGHLLGCGPVRSGRTWKERITASGLARLRGARERLGSKRGANCLGSICSQAPVDPQRRQRMRDATPATRRRGERPRMLGNCGCGRGAARQYVDVHGGGVCRHPPLRRARRRANRRWYPSSARRSLPLRGSTERPRISLRAVQTRRVQLLCGRTRWSSRTSTPWSGWAPTTHCCDSRQTATRCRAPAELRNRVRKTLVRPVNPDGNAALHAVPRHSGPSHQKLPEPSG